MHAPSGMAAMINTHLGLNDQSETYLLVQKWTNIWGVMLKENKHLTVNTKPRAKVALC